MFYIAAFAQLLRFGNLRNQTPFVVIVKRHSLRSAPLMSLPVPISERRMQDTAGIDDSSHSRKWLAARVRLHHVNRSTLIFVCVLGAFLQFVGGALMILEAG